MNSIPANAFYQSIKPFRNFDRITDRELYHPLPDDWIVGVADVVDSTGAIEKGMYKTINTIGAAIISAQMNISGGQAFPFVFGGDGAAFAIWPERRQKTELALRAVKRWAMTEFDMGLRIALVTVSDIRGAGFDVAIARFQVSDGVDYAMFRGGGLVWAENKMKNGDYQLEMAPPDTFPNLEGLSCRWTPLVPKRGLVLSVLAIPRDGVSTPGYQQVVQKILQLMHHIDRGGHPVPDDGPKTSWQPKGVALEAHASHGKQSYFRRLVELRIRTFIAWIFFATNTRNGDFDPRRYRAEVSQNSDFRKFDDGLKMTLDCDEETADKIEQVLETARQENILDFGTYRQNEAMMTCIVPSVATNDHVHFVDGASGGYAMAALKMKKALAGKDAAKNAS